MNQRLMTMLGSSALVVAVGLGVAWYTTQGPKVDPNGPPNNGKDLVQKDNDPRKKDDSPGRADDPWLKRIASTDPVVRRAALGQLGQSKEDLAKAIPVLLASLEEKDPATRSALSDFLAALGRDDGLADPREAAALRGKLADALKDQPTSGKIVAALALGKIGQVNDRAVEPLQKALFGEDRDLQRVAALALRKVSQRQLSEYALPDMADQRAFPARWMRMTHLRTTSSDDNPVIPPLIEALKDSDPALQLWAAEVFSEEADVVQNSTDAIPALVVLFEGKREEVARKAAWGLGKLALRDASVAPKILSALGSADPVAKGRAAEALSRAMRPSTEPGARVQVPKELHSPEAVEALARALADPDAKIRAQVIQTLGWIGSPASAAVPALARNAGNPATDRNERLAIFVALGLIGQDSATVVPLLLKSLKDREEDVRKAAAEALARYGKDAIPGLRKAVGEEDLDIRLGAIQGLAAMGAEARTALPELTSLLKAEPVGTRALAAAATLQIDPSNKDALPVLKAGLETDDLGLRQSLLEAVKTLGPVAATLTPDIAKLLESKDGELPYRAAEALAAIGPPAAAAVPALAAVILKCPDTKGDGSPISVTSPIFLSQKAIEALRQIGPDAKEAVPALVAVLNKCADIDAADTLSILDPTRMEGRAALMEGARTRFENIREVSLRALGRLGSGGKESVPALIELLGKETNLTSPVIETLIRLGPVSVPALVAALDDKNTRFQALHTLGRMGPNAKDAAPAMLKASQAEATSEGLMAIAALGESVTPTLVEAVKDPLRTSLALRALASMQVQAAGASTALGDLLKDKAFQEKAEVLRTLAAIGPAAKSAGPAIQELLKDPGEEVQAAAALATVAVLGDTKAATPVLLKLVVEARNQQARRDAALGLGRIPTEAEKSLSLLQKLLADMQPELRAAGAEALGLLGKDAIKALPDLLKAILDAQAEVQAAACQALGNLGPTAAKEAVPALMDLLKPSVNEKVQKAALLALGKFGSEARAAVPALKGLLEAIRANDLSTGENQTLAAQTLWRIEGKTAMPEIRTYLQRQLTTQTYPPAVAEVLKLIGDLGSDAAEFVPALGQRVDSASQQIRRGAILALGKIGPAARSALPWLQRAAAQETDVLLRQEAKDAIAAIQKG